MTFCAPITGSVGQPTAGRGLADLERMGVVTRLPRRPDYDTHGPEPRGYVEPREVYIVGVSHRSARSAEHVRAVIAALRPDAVVVELCRSRAGQLYPPTPDSSGTGSFQARAPGPFALTGADGFAKALGQALQRGGGPALLIRAMLAASIRRSADENVSSDDASRKNASSVAEGTEFRIARESAEGVGAVVVLGDRPIECTLRRTWQALTVMERCVLALVLLRGAIFGHLRLSDLKDQELRQVIESGEEDNVTSGVVEKYMLQFAEKFPRLMRPLCHERDLYLAWSLKRCEAVKGANVVVGVVGLGHVRGICECIDQDNDYRRRGLLPPLRFKDLVS
jgi:hypothetical protein